MRSRAVIIKAPKAAALHIGISAFTPKADSRQQSRNGREGPISNSRAAVNLPTMVFSICIV